MGRVLVVDDDEGVREIVSEFLADEGYQCTQAGDVKQACKQLKEKEFELAISDFNMPRETGLDFLKYVASNFPSTRFILMSGSTDAELKKEAMALGAMACMSKPFKLEELLEEVQSVIRKELYPN